LEEKEERGRKGKGKISLGASEPESFPFLSATNLRQYIERKKENGKKKEKKGGEIFTRVTIEVPSKTLFNDVGGGGRKGKKDRERGKRWREN